MKKSTFIFSLCALTTLGWGLKAYAQHNQMFLNPPPNTAFLSFANHLPAMDWSKPLETPAFKNYLRFYDLDFAQVKHYAGMIPDQHQRRIFIHALVPEGPSKGTLFALHGYFVHSALLKYVIQRGLDSGYTVIVADLPGHGLSTGDRASIEAFSDYADLVHEMTALITEHLPEPYFLLGHSTGGSGVWEYALKHPDNPYKKIVLGAPLVRSYLWGLSTTGYHLGKNILPEVPRLLRPTTREPEFLELVLRDPLQYPGTPVQWVKALIEWNDNQIETYPPSAQNMLIIQGTEDTVVEAEFNIPFLARKFPLAKVEWVPQCRHDLFWEIEPIRNQVLDSTFEFINAS